MKTVEVIGLEKLAHACGGGEHGGAGGDHGTSGGEHGTTTGDHGTSTTGGHGTTTGGGKPGYVNGAGVNIRKSPTTSAGVLKVGYKCEPITILEQGLKGPGAASWSKILYKGVTGYMATSYVGEGDCRK